MDRPTWTPEDAVAAAELIELQLGDSYDDDPPHIKLLARIVADLCRNVAGLMPT